MTADCTTVRLAITMAGATVGYYGLDYAARPVELKLAQRWHLLAAPQTA